MTEFSRRYYVFRIAFVYAPNRNPERDEFFTSCLEFTDPSVPSILGGDVNAVLTEPEIVGALTLLSPSVIALSHWSYVSGSSVFWMDGAISTPIFALTPG